MSNFAAALPRRTIDAASAPADSNGALHRRKLARRQMLFTILGAYGTGALIIAVFAYGAVVSPMLVIAYLTCGFLSTGFFFILSEMKLSERYDDHYMSFAQVVVNTAIHVGFVLVVPEIGFSFLGGVFVAVSFGALRMSSQQAFVSLSVTALIMWPIFFMTSQPVSLPAATLIERIGAAFCFVVTIVECAIVGRYGSAMRVRLYKKRNELQRAYRRIEELAETDELTGAYNRRSIMRSLDDEIARATRLQQPCSIALMDIDWFKRINDNFGHPAGDEVLRSFAIAAFANIRSIDKFGRYGGEEFLLIIPQTPHDEAIRAVTRLRIIVSQLDWSALSPDMSVTISAGVATLLPNETAESLLARADAALYTAKRSGRNRVDGAI